TPTLETAVAAPLALSGGTLYTLSSDGTLTAFRADAPDTTGPLFTGHYPKAGSALNGKPPFLVAAKVKDFGSGLNFDSVSVALDGKDVTATYSLKSGLLSYKTQSSGRLVDPPLANGRHVVTMRAKDWRGNETVETWSFVVNNSLPERVGLPDLTATPRTGTGTGGGAGLGGGPGLGGGGLRGGGSGGGLRGGGGG
ncbi:hypothetical protein, partial [Armatimonas sp.]|uniref:hypothetical protein n=1 Tax=Armatimonas sp. TaxID=1872638 RepID=UPI003750F314